jgi:hypothetical protein
VAIAIVTLGIATTPLLASDYARERVYEDNLSLLFLAAWVLSIPIFPISVVAAIITFKVPALSVSHGRLKIALRFGKGINLTEITEVKLTHERIDGKKPWPTLLIRQGGGKVTTVYLNFLKEDPDTIVAAVNRAVSPR